ncbi:hypothetical protein RND81_07G158600 [Saponaria officinalis]|uniref:Uncharacterized protein n=1 Tax=Saponaria officinalis TaxID=3572 RepID=A0AAW1JQV7_SAPOF
MEFQECDIMFSDEYSSSDQSSPNGFYSISTRNRNKMMTKTKKKDVQRSSSSTPLNIPGNSSSSSPSSSFRYNDFNGFVCFGDEFYDENEIVPPHVIVDRRSSEFNRIGKGKKNLIHFRNSILKLTGFLES